jgi:hypothetical protein
VSFRILSLALLASSTLALGETLIMQPGPEGKDATVFSRQDAVGKNFGDGEQFQASTWTWNGDNLGGGSFRSLIQFDLGALPAGAVIKSAKLFLYCDTLNYTKGHSSLSSSNAAQLLRVKQAWAESTVTWDNQPETDTDTTGAVKLAQSASAKQNYAVDVTAMIAAMFADSAKNHGFLLRTVAETPYNAIMFGSGDHKDSALHPKLEVEYEYASTRADRGLSASRANTADLRIRYSAGALFLSRAEAGQLVDLHGKVVARFGKTGSVDVGGLKSGAYVLRTESKALKVFVP